MTAMKSIRWMSVTCLFCAWATLAQAQNSAPSSHMTFDDHFDGDILIHAVRVPRDGEAMYTYYETLGWQGWGAGYAGIQAHPKGHNYIFSIWDNKKHSAPIKAVYRGPGTETQAFGGEGTGLKSWNFELGWSTGVWYTWIARCWPVGDHTCYGAWVRAGDNSQWTHLVTMEVATPNASFGGGTDAFIEDWLNTGAKPRTIHLRGGWKRRLNGSWFPFAKVRYSVNDWDLIKGKRSYNFRTNWNGGVAEDTDGSFYFMTSGGATTKPSAANPSRHTIERRETKPEFTTIKLSELSIKREDHALSLHWEVDGTTLPQFGYRIEVYADEAGQNEPLISSSATSPHDRTATLDASSLNLDQQTYYVRLRCIDILDGVSEARVARIGRDVAK